MIVACVRTGTKYGVEYVKRLRRMVARHLPVSHRFVCLTDNPDALGEVETVDIRSLDLPGWWGKIALFRRDWRQGEDVLYFDLDTVVVRSLFPLVALDLDFGICASFTRAAGITTWPCFYGSCVMKIGANKNSAIYDAFAANPSVWMERFKKYGDQAMIECVEPDATLLQKVLPAGFFMGYRDLPNNPDVPPLGCSVVVFAGSHKPESCLVPWVRDEWAS